MEAKGCAGSWLIVHGGEVVGLCSFKGPPDANGSAEIGYGVAASRRSRGFATAAVARLCEELRAAGSVRALRAETAEDNRPSQRVLEHNRFRRVGARVDPEDGPLVLWAVELV